MDLNTKWAIAIYGWAAYNIISFFILKQKADKKGESFNYPKFIVTHWDNWAVTAFFALPVVAHGPEIHDFLINILNSVLPFKVEIKWYDFFYAGPGPLVELIYFFATSLWPSIKRRTLIHVNGKSNGKEN